MLKRRLWWVAAAALLALGGCDDPVDPVDGGGTDGGHQMMDDGGTCEGVADSCTTAGTSCDGTTLVTCAANADGCLVATTMSCSAIGEVCDDSGAEAQCVEPVDPCEGVAAEDLCETEDARACNEDSLEVCTMNAAGCLVLERTDCGAAEGGFCDESGAMPVCVAPADPCASIPADERCTAEGTSCDGDSLVTCAPDAFGCLVETATDCSTATDGTCEGTPAMCTFTGDACEGVTECDAAGTSCDGPDLVECAPDAFGCLLETRTTCTDAMFGFCDADAATPMCSTAATDPCMGETQCGTEITRACNGDNTAVESCVPNAFGCFVEETTACAGNQTCELDDSGSAACEFIHPACPAAELMVLDCASGTVSADTAMGAANITNYECQTYSYPSNEQIWVFENADRALVTIAATRGNDDGDYDLYVLDGSSGGMCDSGLACLDSSTTTSATEVVEFVAVPGATNYVVYDKFSSAGTTPYTLDITCEPIVCGDGVLTGDETCEDGNTASGDGCSDICQVEPDYYCSGSPSVCVPMICGDGVVVGDEECDDANTTPGDGCSDTCEIEAGYVCDGEGAGSCTMLQHHLCSGARAVTETVTFANQPLAQGGPKPSGSGCGLGSGSRTLYYEVTIPPNTKVVVDAEDGPDTVMMVQNACSDDGCIMYSDTPEIVELGNTGTTAITQIVGVRQYSTATASFDIDFTYEPLTGHALCAGARTVTGTTSFTGEDIGLGGPRPQGTGCGTSSGNSALYYAVTLPPMTEVNVTTSGSVDRVLLVQDSCEATSCSHRTDSDPEKATLRNLEATPTTQIVAIHKYDAADLGTFDIDFTYRTLAPNAGCSGATPLTGLLSGEDLSDGGPRPTGSNCGSTAGPVLYYSVTVPANSTATVTATPTGSTSWNLTLRSLEDCSGDCLGNVNAGSNGVAETIDLVNITNADMIRLVAVGANSSTTFGTFDIEVTTAALTYAANATCAGATPLVSGTPITGEDTAVGGAAPTGTTCDTTGAQTLYYEVTVPAGQIGTVVVDPASGFDVAVMALDSCGAADCSVSVDGFSGGGDETLTIDNFSGTTDITRVVAVNAYAAGRTGTFGIELTVSTPAPGSMCAAAIPVTTDVTLTGQLEDGGPRPTATGCGGGTGTNTLYYAVTVPAGGSVDVEASSSADILLFKMESCEATSCSGTADSNFNNITSPETITLDNTAGTADAVQIFGVRRYAPSSTQPAVELTFTYSAP